MSLLKSKKKKKPKKVKKKVFFLAWDHFDVRKLTEFLVEVLERADARILADPAFASSLQDDWLTAKERAEFEGLQELLRRTK